MGGTGIMGVRCKECNAPIAIYDHWKVEDEHYCFECYILVLSSSNTKLQAENERLRDLKSTLVNEISELKAELRRSYRAIESVFGDQEGA